MGQSENKGKDPAAETERLREELREKEEQLRRLQETLEQVDQERSFYVTALENLPNPIFVKDENAKFIFFNRSYAEAFGMRRRDYIGKSALELDYLPLEDRVRYQKEDEELIRTAATLSYEVDFDFADGQKHPSFYWSQGVHDERTGRSGLIGEIVDISEERRLRESLDHTVEKLRRTNSKLERMAEIDAGTGIYNRSLLSRTERDIRGGKDGRLNCAMMADLDHFKRVNDRYGHLKGDEILAQFAAILRSESRSNDVAIRYGGEEFLLFLSNATLETGVTVAERIRRRCESEIMLPDGEPITVSLGVACMENSLTLEENIAKLDEQLYLAKNNGRNRVESEKADAGGGISHHEQ